MDEPIPGEFEGAWRRFQKLDTLRLLHETIEGEWRVGRTDYVAFLARITDPGVRAYIAHTLEALADVPGVDPYPERYWHITIKGLGFTRETALRDDELPAREVRRVADAARPILESASAFTAQAGPVSAFPEVVILEIHDGGAVRALNTRLLDDVPGLQRYPIDGPVFLPHISIARFTSDEGLAELKQRLTDLRADARARPNLRIDEIELVQAHLAADAPTFELIDRYPLH